MEAARLAEIGDSKEADSLPPVRFTRTGLWLFVPPRITTPRLRSLPTRGWFYKIGAGRFPASRELCLAIDMILSPNKSPEPTAVGAVSSAIAVHVASRRWLSFRSEERRVGKECRSRWSP